MPSLSFPFPHSCLSIPLHFYFFFLAINSTRILIHGINLYRCRLVHSKELRFSSGVYGSAIFPCLYAETASNFSRTDLIDNVYSGTRCEIAGIFFCFHRITLYHVHISLVGNTCTSELASREIGGADEKIKEKRKETTRYIVNYH